MRKRVVATLPVVYRKADIQRLVEDCLDAHSILDPAWLGSGVDSIPTHNRFLVVQLASSLLHIAAFITLFCVRTGS